jgi:hypothetical protein
MAIDKACEKYPGKIINYKHSKNMDLIEAKVQAAKVSKEQSSVVYIFNNEKTEEVELTTDCPKKKDTVLSIYEHRRQWDKSKVEEFITGVVLPTILVPTESLNQVDSGKPVKKVKDKPAIMKVVKETPQQEKKELTKKLKESIKMEKTKKKPAKAAKKVAKKVTKKTSKVVTPKKTERKPVVKATLPPHVRKSLTVKEIIKLVKDGQKVFNENNKPLPLGYLSKMGDTSRVIHCAILK